MKEKPIIFNSEMVRAILDGRKTQTRRVIKPQFFDLTGSDDFGIMTVDNDWNKKYIKCPYGQPGDRLWVREKFRVERPFTGDVDYDFTHQNIFYYATDNEKYRDKDKWKPSIHMPRTASRITLEITNIRVERLQDISEADAQYEGTERPILSATEINGWPVHPMTGDYSDGYRTLWDSINLKCGYGWDVNPWVWVIEFKKI